MEYKEMLCTRNAIHRQEQLEGSLTPTTAFKSDG